MFCGWDRESFFFNDWTYSLLCRNYQEYESFIAIQPENTGMKFGPYVSALVLKQLDYDVPGTTATGC